MLKELIKVLKIKKKQLENSLINDDIKEEPTFNINISKDNNIYKIEINDYISIIDYLERMKSIDNYNLVNLISNNVLWNANKQKVNKGIFYIILDNNKLYNILIQNEILIINERVKKEDITEEKIISFNKINNNYDYCKFKHDKTGNTFYTRYYIKDDFSLEKIAISKEEAFEDINSITYNLENIEEINNIINTKILKQHILEDLTIKKLERRKSLTIDIS